MKEHNLVRQNLHRQITALKAELHWYQTAILTRSGMVVCREALIASFILFVEDDRVLKSCGENVFGCLRQLCARLEKALSSNDLVENRRD